MGCLTVQVARGKALGCGWRCCYFLVTETCLVAPLLTMCALMEPALCRQRLTAWEGGQMT